MLLPKAIVPPVKGSVKMNRYAYKPSTITAPLFPFSNSRPATDVLRWTEAQKAAFTLETARANVASLAERYTAACASLGVANRTKGTMRKIWQAKAFRYINATRKQMREAAAALVAALANPALASDQVAA